MRRVGTIVLLVGWGALLSPVGLAGPEPKLVLPPVIHAVPGTETVFHFANAVLPEPAEPFSFAAACPVGRIEKNRWVFDAAECAPGSYPFELILRDATGASLDRAETSIRVVAKDAGAGEDIALLLVGDSLTHASLYPNELARLLSRPGNSGWKMLGTHHPSRALPEVNHEGYGGWTWARFNTRYEPGEPGTGKTRNSPFLFPASEEPGASVRWDVGRYFMESCGGRAPDFVTFLLGINDCFHADPEDPEAIDERIDRMFREAEKLLAEFRRAAPEADLGICLTPPGNARDGAFRANYGDRYTRWGWRRIQFRLVERQIEHFGGREKEKLFLIPTSLSLDTLSGYPENNGVHPNADGYGRIAADIYAWLKWRLAEAS